MRTNINNLIQFSRNIEETLLSRLDTILNIEILAKELDITDILSQKTVKDHELIKQNADQLFDALETSIIPDLEKKYTFTHKFTETQLTINYKSTTTDHQSIKKEFSNELEKLKNFFSEKLLSDISFRMKKEISLYEKLLNIKLSNLQINNNNLLNQLDTFQDLQADFFSNWIGESLTQNNIEIDKVTSKLKALRNNVFNKERTIISDFKTKLDKDYDNLFRLEITSTVRQDTFIQKYSTTLAMLILILFCGLLTSSILIMIRIIFFNKE